MAAHKAPRHETPVGRPEHVRRVHSLGVEDAGQSVEESRRVRDLSIVRSYDPVAVLEGRDAGETGLADHRPARQDKYRLFPVAAGDVVPIHPGNGGVFGWMRGPELP